MGHGERVVGSQRVPFLVHPLEQREVDDPAEPVRPLAHRPAAELGAQVAEHRAGQPVLVGHHQDQVTGTGTGDGQEAGPLVVAHELLDRRVEGEAPRPSPRRRLPPPSAPGPTRNQARPLAPSALARSVSTSRRDRPSDPPPSTTMAFTHGASKTRTEVAGEHVRSGRAAPCRSGGRACRCRSGRGPRTR